MVKFSNLLVGIFIVIGFLGCKNNNDQLAQKLTKEQDKVVYEDASVVPIGKLGVFIVIDSLGLFQNNSDEFNKNVDKILLEELTQLNNHEEIEQYIEKRANKILTDQNKNFEFVKIDPNIKAKEIYKPDFNAKKYVNFFQKLPYDDFLLVAVRSGISNTDTGDIEGKTNIYISIIEKNTLESKYYETLTGSKYLTKKDYKTNFDYHKNLIKESIEHTFDIIDTKY